MSGREWFSARGAVRLRGDLDEESVDGGLQVAGGVGKLSGRAEHVLGRAVGLADRGGHGGDVARDLGLR
jgi:hypothetical protein